MQYLEDGDVPGIWDCCIVLKYSFNFCHILQSVQVLYNSKKRLKYVCSPVKLLSTDTLCLQWEQHEDHIVAPKACACIV